MGSPISNRNQQTSQPNRNNNRNQIAATPRFTLPESPEKSTLQIESKEEFYLRTLTENKWPASDLMQGWNLTVKELDKLERNIKHDLRDMGRHPDLHRLKSAVYGMLRNLPAMDSHPTWLKCSVKGFVERLWAERQAYLIERENWLFAPPISAQNREALVVKMVLQNHVGHRGDGMN